MSDDTEQEIPEQNDQLVLVSGASGTGKSGSLMNIPNQERWFYFNCEAGKRLPFRNKFNQVVITDPWDVHGYFDELIANPDASDGVVIDSITFLMDMFESQYIIGAKDTQKGWSMYAQFFKILLQQKIAAYRKPVIIIAHTLAKLNEQAMEMEVSVPIKGALKNQGVEAYFSTVVSPKKIPIKDLKDYQNDLLTITDEDEILGYKHVFQTRLTKQTTGERIRSPMGMFTREQTYINSDTNVLLNHLREFYA